METNVKPTSVPTATVSVQDGGVKVKHLQMQPVETSGGQDLAKDLVWQRDPDCTKDPVHVPVMSLTQVVPGIQTQGIAVNQTQGLSSNQTASVQGGQPPVGYAMPSVTAMTPQNATGYQFQGQSPVIPNPTGDHAPGAVVQTFQLPPGTVYTGIRPPGVVTYVPVTTPQTVFMDTDGNTIQQTTTMQQNIPITGYPAQQNLIPVQYNPNFVQGRNVATSGHVVSMPPPATNGQQQTSYPRLVPYNQQFLAVPNTNFNNPSITKPTSLNVTIANNPTQKPSASAVQMSSPTALSPAGQSPTVTSPGTESVKSPTYVFMCNKCNYVTPHRSSFKTHYSSHIQYKPYQCAYCDHATIMKQPMQKHVKMKHAIEDAEGFTYESDSKKENIIEFFCNQCRSTMNMEEAKKYLAKYESTEKPKPGPSKRKLSLDEKEDDTTSPLKRKKKISLSESGEENQNQPEGTVDQLAMKVSQSPRKLTHWKQRVNFKSVSEKPKLGRPRKFKGDNDSSGKKFSGRQTIKFPGFGKKKFISPTGGNFVKCPNCDFKSGSKKGLTKHCYWRHHDLRLNCTKCLFSTFFPEDLDLHSQNDQCENESINILSSKKFERGKSPVKTLGRPRKSLVESEETNIKTSSEPLSDDDGNENSDDDVQLNCPHCNFVSHSFALKRHLFFYHKECDWKCKICGFKSNSKKETVRHSNKAHPNTQPNVVQTFADISSILQDEVSEHNPSTPPEKDVDKNDKVVIKRHLIDRDFIKTNKKRFNLGKKRVSLMANGESGGQERMQTNKFGMERKGQKRGRKREETVSDQSSFVVRPKKLKIARIGFSCVYCTYAAPLRHQLRLHCYEKHTKHPACLMEFSNSRMALEEQRCRGRDMVEDGKTDVENEKLDKKEDGCVDDKKEDLDRKDEKDPVKPENKGSDELQMEVDPPSENNKEQSENRNEVGLSGNQKSNAAEKDKEPKEMEVKDEKTHSDENMKTSNENSAAGKDSRSVMDEDQKEVLSCMESILENIGSTENSTKIKTDREMTDTLKYILPGQTLTNGHKFSNPFSTLIVQLNSTQLKVKDAFEGTLDDVDVYLEKFGVRTLNMDSLTPRQFALFMRKFGNSLQQLSV